MALGGDRLEHPRAEHAPHHAAHEPALGRRDHVDLATARRVEHGDGAVGAVLEAQIGVKTLLERFPNLRMPAQDLVWKTVPGFRGLESLTVEV